VIAPARRNAREVLVDDRELILRCQGRQVLKRLRVTLKKTGID
jgi:hypothetical protein